MVSILSQASHALSHISNFKTNETDINVGGLLNSRTVTQKEDFRERGMGKI